MKNILITGAGCFIGANLANKLSETKNNVTLLIRKKTDVWRINHNISKFDIKNTHLFTFTLLFNVFLIF